MAIDPYIAAGIQPIQTGVMSPMQGLQLRQLALGNQAAQADFADQQLARANRVKLRDVFNQPGSFDQETGAPTPETIQAAGGIDPMFAMNMAREAHLTRQQYTRAQNQQALSDLRDAQADAARTKQEKLRIENMHTISRDFTTAALSRYQSAVDQGMAPDVAGDSFRQAWLDEIDQREKSGALKSAGYTDEEIAQLKANVPTPDQAQKAMETSREREIRKKAELDNPITRTRLAQTDRRLDQADQRLAIADVKAQTRAGGQTAAGVKLEKAPAGYRYIEGGAALEPIPGGPADKGTPGGMPKQEQVRLEKEKESQIATYNREVEEGKITQEQADAAIAKLTASKGGATASREQYIKPPAGYQWEEGGKRLTPIPGGPADKPKLGSSPTLSGTSVESQNLHGEAFLATLKPEYADRIKAIASGRFKIDLFSKNKKERAQIADDVLQYKPDYQEPTRSTNSSGTLSDKAVRVIADQVAAGDNTPMQRLAPTDKARILNRVADMQEARGQGGKDLAANRQSYAGGTAAARSAGTRGVNIDLAAEELDNFAGIGIKASAAVPRTNFVAVNKLLRLGREQWSPEQAAFEAANRSIINAFAQVASRSGNATVHNTEEAEHMLNTAQTHDQYVAVIKQLQTEARQAIKATKTVKGALREETSGRKEAPEQPKAAAPAAPAKKTIKFGDLK